MSHAEAVRIISEGRREHFDPVVVDAFLQCEQKLLKISESDELIMKLF